MTFVIRVMNTPLSLRVGQMCPNGSERVNRVEIHGLFQNNCRNFCIFTALYLSAKQSARMDRVVLCESNERLPSLLR